MNPIDHLHLDRLPIDRLPIDQIESTLGAAVGTISDSIVDDVMPVAVDTVRSGQRYVRRHPRGAAGFAVGFVAAIALIIWLRRRAAAQAERPQIASVSDVEAA